MHLIESVKLTLKSLYFAKDQIARNKILFKNKIVEKQIFNKTECCERVSGNPATQNYSLKSAKKIYREKKKEK